MHQRLWNCYTPHVEHTWFILQKAVVCLIRQIYHELFSTFLKIGLVFRIAYMTILIVDCYMVLFRGSRTSKKMQVFIWNIFQRRAACHLSCKRHSRGDVWVNATGRSNRPAQHKHNVIRYGKHAHSVFKLTLSKDSFEWSLFWWIRWLTIKQASISHTQSLNAVGCFGGYGTTPLRWCSTINK